MRRRFSEGVASDAPPDLRRLFESLLTRNELVASAFACFLQSSGTVLFDNHSKRRWP